MFGDKFVPSKEEPGQKDFVPSTKQINKHQCAFEPAPYTWPEFKLNARVFIKAWIAIPVTILLKIIF